MTDYVKAFQQGLSAAEVALRTKDEIKGIFIDLNKQIFEDTKGNITIGVQERNELIKFTDWLAPAKESFDLLKPGKVYNAICAHNPKIPGGPVKDLARWTQDRRGYPCKIEWEGTTLICEDGEALKNALAELLADPLVGEKLYTLMKLSDI